MKKSIKYLVVFLMTHLFFLSFSFAEESLINTMLNVQKSLVDITALQTQIDSAPQASAGITPSGKVIVAQKIKQKNAVKKSSGIIISPEGFLITNLHAVQGAHKIIVQLYDGSSYPAQILYLSAPYDLALLKIKTTKILQAVALADSDKISLGEEVFTIGNSDVLNNTISSGIIRGLGTKNTGKNNKQIELIKIKMNIYKGDSGGPVLNREGKLIGIMAAKLGRQDRASIAIASNKIRKLYLEFLKNSYNIQQ